MDTASNGSKGDTARLGPGIESLAQESAVENDDTSERLDFPADGHAVVGPSTCITHVGEVSFAAKDDDGRLSRLSNWFFDRLRKMCL